MPKALAATVGVVLVLVFLGFVVVTSVAMRQTERVKVLEVEKQNLELKVVVLEEQNKRLQVENIDFRRLTARLAGATAPNPDTPRDSGPVDLAAFEPQVLMDLLTVRLKLLK